MKVQALGHVVLNVRSRARSEAFYAGVLGLPIATRSEPFAMTMFTLGNHHDFAIREVGEAAPTPPESAVGLRHVAFKIGESRDELREAKRQLEAAGVTVTPIDHGITESLYFTDPDGNPIELYVDVSEAWRHQTNRVPKAEPLALE
jgi:catechol 2,3-dioxygenase